jgi:hypothetical protein
MAAEKKDRLVVVVPNEEKFKPAPIPFGVISGDGVDNYEGDDKEYTVSLLLSKKENDDFRDTVMEFWDEFKPNGAGDKPDNWKNLTRKDKENDKGFILYAKTRTHFGDKPNVIDIRNHEGSKLDPEEYGSIGKGSEGRIAVTLIPYARKRDFGVSVFLSAVKLTKFVKFESSGGGAAFGAEAGDVEADGFKPEKKDKSKKKDKKKKKK